MTDYIGNEIKVGDEVCFIKILDKQLFHVTGFLIGGGGFREVETPKRPDKECFKKGKYYKVFEYNGHLAYQIKAPYYTMTDFLPPMCLTFDTHIIAIKGVSDSKEQYLKFKNTTCKDL